MPSTTDGTSLNVQSGGDTIDTEYISARTAKLERVKVVIGNIDVDGGDVSSSNPFPVGGIHHDAVQILVDGQSGQLQLDGNSYLQVSDMTLHPGADNTRNVQKIEQQWPVAVVLTGNIGATVVINKACNFGGLVIGSHGSQATSITISDGASTNAITVKTVPGASPCYVPFNEMMNINLTIQVTGNTSSDISIGVLAS